MQRHFVATAFALLALAGGMAIDTRGRDAAQPNGPTDSKLDGTRTDNPPFDPTRLDSSTDDRSKCEPGQPNDGAAKRKVHVDPVTGVAVDGPTIVQIGIDGCPPCAEFMATGRLKYKDVGWDVREVKYPVAKAQVYPSYRIFEKGEWKWHHGPMTTSSFAAAIGRPKASTDQEGKTQVTTRVSTSTADPVSLSIPASSGLSWTIGGQPWTEGRLRQHLYDSNHGYPPGSLDGLSLAELDALHSADHEGLTSPRQSQFVTRSQSGYMPSSSASTIFSSGCPTGGCPPQSPQMRSRAVRFRSFR